MVKPGGRILIVAQCAEGVGSPEFARKLASMKSFSSFLEEIRNAPVEVDQWQLEKLALVGEKYELYFFTPGVTRGQLGFLAEQVLALDPSFDGLCPLRSCHPERSVLQRSRRICGFFLHVTPQTPRVPGPLRLRTWEAKRGIQL
jgi:hypothetical protein